MMEPNKNIRAMHDSLVREGGGHRKMGPYTLDLMPDGSWELSRYARLLYVIDARGRGKVYIDDLTLPEVRAVNSLSILVTGAKAILSKKEVAS